MSRAHHVPRPKHPTAAWFRKEHKPIPEELYKVTPKARQEHSKAYQRKHPNAPKYIEKNNYGPLGRPPENPVSRKEKYQPEIEHLTPKGIAGLSARRRTAYYDKHNVPESQRIKTPVKPKKPSKPKVKKSASMDRKARARMQYEKEQEEYLRALSEWRDAEAREFVRRYDTSEINAELEDRGYGDTRKNWRRTGMHTRARAYMDEQANEYRDRYVRRY